MNYFSCMRVVWLLCLFGLNLQAISPLTAESAGFNQKQHDITLRVKKITEIESKQLFDGTNFLKQGVQPLQGYIYNNSNKPCALFSHAIGIPLMQANQIKMLCEKRFSFFHLITGLIKAAIIGALIVAGAFVIGTLFFGSILLIVGLCESNRCSLFDLTYLISCGLQASITLPINILGVLFIAGGPIVGLTTATLLTAGGILVMGTSALGIVENEELVAEIQGNMVASKMIIEPHTGLDFLMFVDKKDYKSTFPLAVQHDLQSVVFDVTLPQ